jgi:(R,R)-butanediol dehydrogenase/meso-butanediol dehydrogenase/diacetyl reductase
VKAARFHGPGDVRVEQVPDPDEPGPGEVLIRVAKCGICGTDGHEYAHGPAMIPLRERHRASGHLGPMTIGHEFTGTIVAAADGVAFPDGRPARSGTRIVAGAGRWCGECEPCLAGRTNLCSSYYTYGLHANGGLAEFVTVPAGMCVAVPEGCDDASAVLAQPMAIAMHALSRGSARTGEPVVIVGAGGIGSLLIAAATARGIPAHVLDLDEQRLDAARCLGALTAARPDDKGLAAARALGRTGAPLVIEASGTDGGLRTALAIAGTGGRVVMLGLPRGDVSLAVRPAVIAEVDLVSSSAHVCRTDLPAAVTALARHPIAGQITSDTVPLDEIVPRGLAPLAAGTLTGKAVIAIR